MCAMITASSGDSPLILTATVQGLAVYLDNFAIKALAKGDPSRRRRFVELIHKGGDLIFSVANAVELSGPQDKSFDVIKAFLNDLDHRWYPVELDVIEVVKRESRGESPATSCISKKFMADYLRLLLSNGSDRIVSFSKEFFRLGPAMDWMAEQRDSIRRGQSEFDEVLRTRINMQLAEQQRDPGWLDRKYPVLAFEPSKPATFAFVNLKGFDTRGEIFQANERGRAGLLSCGNGQRLRFGRYA
jgi:hypothetical protein